MSWSKPVFSSMCVEVGYDERLKGMVVTWKNGKRSLYEGVDEETALQCANAPSVGQFLNMEIKPNFNNRYV